MAESPNADERAVEAARSSSRSSHRRPLNPVRLVSLLIFFTLTSGIASAADHHTYARGFFVGGGWNGSFENFDTDFVDFDDAVGLSARGGYRFGKWIATELQYEWSGTFDGDRFGSEIDLYYFSVNAKVYPLQTWLQPYALVGVGALYGYLDTNSGDEDDTDLAFRFGGGAEIPILARLRLTINGAYMQPLGDLDDFEYFTLGAGVIWYFGGP
jgi:opacity protein-like surface antigen